MFGWGLIEEIWVLGWLYWKWFIFFLKMKEVKLKYGECKFILFVDLLSYRVIEYLIELLNMIIFNWVKII